MDNKIIDIMPIMQHNRDLIIDYMIKNNIQRLMITDCVTYKPMGEGEPLIFRGITVNTDSHTLSYHYKQKSEYGNNYEYDWLNSDDDMPLEIENQIILSIGKIIFCTPK